MCILSRNFDAFIFYFRHALVAEVTVPIVMNVATIKIFVMLAHVDTQVNKLAILGIN